MHNIHKFLIALSCFIALTFGWVSDSFISPARAVPLNDYQLIADLGSYGRGNDADRSAKRTLREENGISKFGDTAEKTPPNVSAKTDNSTAANSIHGRARLEVGKAQSAMDDAKGQAQGAVKKLVNKVSGK